MWSGFGIYRHGQKTFADRAGHFTSGIPGQGEGVTRDHPEGQRPSAWVGGTTGDRGPAGGLCRAHNRASFHHLPGHPTEASCRPKRAEATQSCENYIIPSPLFLGRVPGVEENSSEQRGGGEQRERRGEKPCPFPRAGFQDEAGLSQGRREELRLIQVQNFNYYVGLGMTRSEARLFFATQRIFVFIACM